MLLPNPTAKGGRATLLEEFQQRLVTLTEAIKAGNPDRLASLLKAGKRNRDQWNQ